MLAGNELIRNIDCCRTEYNRGAIWWLGQHSFIVKLGTQVLYLDLFLSPLAGRRIPPLFEPRQISNAHLFLGTHDHTDHIDRAVWPALAEASPQARFIVPKFLEKQLARDLKMPEARFIGLDDGTSVELDGIKITGIAASHEFLDRDPATGWYPYLGYVIEGNGCTMYHAGDCCIYEGLQTKLKRWSFDAVFLPINGRDARRLATNCIGNMTYQEAADLAGSLRPKYTIPAHYDMFEENQEDPALFVDYMKVKYPNLEVVLCNYGVCTVLTG